VTPTKQPEAVLSLAARPRAEFDQPPLVHYQQLVASLAKWLDESGNVPQIIGITSSGPGEGVSTTAANVAAVAAQTLDLGVVLLDARGSRPSLNSMMELARSPGLGEYLNGMASLADCLCDTWLERLSILPAGTLRDGAPTFQDRSRVEALFSELRAGFGLVVVDLPPVAEAGGWLSLASHFDGVILVVAAQRVGDSTARKAVEQLRRKGAHLLGAVFNGFPQLWPGRLGYRL